MNRIERRFQDLKRAGKKALIAYITAGDPDLEATGALILELEKAGVDIVEIGIPFSDPTADGPAIQAASQRALRSGTTLPGIFRMIEGLRRKSDIPIVLFGYFNPILSFGCERFAAEAARTGIDGVLIVDLPLEESAELRRHTDPLGIHFISLIAPTTNRNRVRRICRSASGFIYYISVTGVTGTDRPSVENIRRDVRSIRSATDLPVAVGFGISTPDDAAGIAPHADAVVVGSAFVRLIERHSADRKSLFRRLSAFAASLRRAI